MPPTTLPSRIPLLRPTVALVFTLSLFYILVHGREFLYPIALGALLAFLLVPVSARLERWHWPRPLAILVPILSVIAVVYGIVWLVQHQVAALTAHPDELKRQAQQNVNGLVGPLLGHLGISVDKDPQHFGEQLKHWLTAGPLASILGATSRTLLAIGLLPVYTFMFLFYRDKLRTFLLLGLSEARRPMMERILKDVSSVTVHYISGVCGVVAILAVLNTVGFSLIGTPSPVLLGLIAAACASIPYFGNIAGYSIAVLITLVAGHRPETAGYVALQFVVVQFIENNVLTPNIVGNSVRLSPFFIIIGVLGGSLLWGLPGTFVVVPVLAMIKVTCEHVPRYKRWGFLLSDRHTPHEVQQATWAQRLLSWHRKPRR